MKKNIKQKWLMLLILGMIFILGACKSEKQTKSNQENSSVEKIDHTNTGMRTIDTINGPIEVPENPKRVVIEYFTGDLFALGISPVGVSNAFEEAAFYPLIEEAEDLEILEKWDGEHIMARNPDLIILINQDGFEQISQIAPTVYLPFESMTQEERVSFLGEVLNRQAEAKKANTNYEDSLKKARLELEQAGFNNFTLTILEDGQDSSMWVSGDMFGAGKTSYRELGLTPPTKVQETFIKNKLSKESVSFETLSEFCGDFIIRNTYEDMTNLESTPIWNSLPAVENNRVVEIPFGINYYSDIYSTTAQVEAISKGLLQAVNP